MELKRRFIFHGDAVAIGGRIARPDDILIDPRCASALPVTGGRTTGSIKGMRFGRYVRFASAATLAEGVFDNRRQVVALSHGKVRQEELASTTTVRAELLGLHVGIGPELTVRRLRASFTAKSPAAADGETAIRLGADVAIDGVSIDGHRLTIELNKAPFQKNDTHSSLRGTDGLVLIESRGIVHATIVRSIRWSGKPFPGASIDGHLVTIPEFGRLYVGELLISRDSRRLTMLRLELGSPFGGDVSGADVQDNGSWSP